MAWSLLVSSRLVLPADAAFGSLGLLLVPLFRGRRSTVYLEFGLEGLLHSVIL